MRSNISFQKHITIYTNPLYYQLDSKGKILAFVDVSDRTLGLFDLSPASQQQLQDVNRAAQAYVYHEAQHWQRDEPIEHYVLLVYLHSGVEYDNQAQSYRWEVFFSLRHKDMLDG